MQDIESKDRKCGVFFPAVPIPEPPDNAWDCFLTRLVAPGQPQGTNYELLLNYKAKERTLLKKSTNCFHGSYHTFKQLCSWPSWHAKEICNSVLNGLTPSLHIMLIYTVTNLNKAQHLAKTTSPKKSSSDSHFED